MIASDLADRIRWETIETEWQDWDGPWDYEGKTPEELAAELEEAVRLWEKRVACPETEEPVLHFEICVNDPARTHIGWCSAYFIDRQCNISEAGERCAVGLAIPPTAARRRGYAAAALSLFLRYLQRCGLTDLYTQTWSGNVRMIGLAEKLGFQECCRKPGLRRVRGAVYDGLTFRLDPDQFSERNLA